MMAAWAADEPDRIANRAASATAHWSLNLGLGTDDCDMPNSFSLFSGAFSAEGVRSRRAGNKKAFPPLEPDAEGFTLPQNSLRRRVGPERWFLGRLPGFRVVAGSSAFPSRSTRDSGWLRGPKEDRLADHSGGTAADLHGLSFSPRTRFGVTAGTGFSKNNQSPPSYHLAPRDVKVCGSRPRAAGNQRISGSESHA